MALFGRRATEKDEELPPTLSRDGAPARRQTPRGDARQVRGRDAQGEQYAQLRRQERGHTAVLVAVVIVLVVLVVVVGLLAGEGSVAG